MMISNEEKIYNEIVNSYPQFLKSLKSVSKNTSDNKMLLESDFKVFDFDNVQNEHVSCDSVVHKSPDCLIYYNGILYFIEFKQGSAKTHDIRLKIHEAIATLYNFTQKNIPTISRNEFFKLHIRYAVILKKGNPATFLDTLNTISTRFYLKNLEGYLLKKTKVTNNPEEIHKIFKSLSNNAITNLIVHNDNYPPEIFA
ncbi:MAG: hypothetical protein GYB16_07415 [Gammaproteobacteria bacterium]|nr:hypothetical protein [Gammaproteobacteria bacterium]